MTTPLFPRLEKMPVIAVDVLCWGLLMKFVIWLDMFLVLDRIVILLLERTMCSALAMLVIVE